jgi:hypothetical protein
MSKSSPTRSLVVWYMYMCMHLHMHMCMHMCMSCLFPAGWLLYPFVYETRPVD